MLSKAKTESTAQNLIESALEKLPIQDGDNAIPYSQAIPGIARQVMTMRMPSKMGSMRKTAASDLDRVVKDAARLARLIKAQFPEERERLSNPRFPVTALLSPAAAMEMMQLCSSLEHFVATARRDRKSLEKIPRGRAHMRETLEIGCYLYQEFERLTGKRPTRTVRNGKSSGQFQTLIETVFSALQIKASAEATTVRVMETMKKRRGN